MLDLSHTEILQHGATIATLAVLEGLLSADNALVLAVLVKHLPHEERGRALKYGIVGAFVFRAIGLLMAGYLVRIWWLKGLGALYLLYLCVSHFWRKHQESKAREQGNGDSGKAPMSFWKTVVAVELTDIAFSIDSIIAAVGLSSNMYVIYLGGVLGIIAMRFVAGYFLRLLEIFSALEVSAYLLVGWIGLKLCLEVYVSQTQEIPAGEHAHGMPTWLFWTVMAVIFAGGFMFKPKAAEKKEEKAEPPAT